MCGALNYFLALVLLGFVPTAGVSITVGGVVGAEGSVGTMMSSSKHGQLILHHYRANTQLRWRHGAARKFKECDHGAMGMQAEVIGPMQIRNWFAPRGSVVPWAVCGRWADLHFVLIVLTCPTPPARPGCLLS